MMEEDPAWFGGMLTRIKELVEEGKIESLPLKVFDMRGSDENGIDAFRYMQRAQHIGKVIIKIPTPFKYLELDTENHKSDVFGPEKVGNNHEYGIHVITGGLGGIGKIIIKWMLEEGVRKIAILSRSANNDSLRDIPEIKDYLNTDVVQIECIKCDVSILPQVENAFREIFTKFGETNQIHGIFHAAGILMDGAIASQTMEMMESVYAPKVYGAWNLHECCEKFELNKNLKHFVMFSSVASLLGNFGQTNYSAANSCLDSLVEYRRNKGMCGTSIQWGPWIEQGMAANLKQHLEKVGMYGISNELGIRVLNDILCFVSGSTSVIGCQTLKWDTFMRRYNTIPTFLSEVDYSSQGRSQGHVDISKLSDEELVVVIAQIAQQCASSPTLPSPDTVLLDLGLDSLGAVEFRNSVLEMTGVKLPQTLVFENPTIYAISMYVRDQNSGNNTKSDSKKHYSQASSEQAKMTIEQWLLSSLKQSERYILYAEAFEKKYQTISNLIAETDIISALEELGVENNQDYDLLYVSWNELISSEEENSKKQNDTNSKKLKEELIFDPIADVEEIRNSMKLNLDGILATTDPSEFKTALLTGVTGFVGRILLVKLIEEFKNMQIVCLVRANSPEKGLERIINVCEEAEVWNPTYASRIIVECGNFEEEYLGLSEERYYELCKEIDVVYHIGGDVNLLSNYKRLRKTNTLSLVGIINFCTTIKLKHLHFSSTLGQFPAFFAVFTREFENAVVKETEGPSTREMSRLFPPTRQGYPWSKWAAEQILETAHQQGLPLSIYRLPNTYIASDTGYTNKTDYATALLIASILEGMFPIGSSTAPLTPVNTICEIIISASKKKERKHWRYNLLDTRILGKKHVEAWASQLGLGNYKGVPIDEFFSAIKSRGPESPIFKFVPLMQYWRHYWFDNTERTQPFPVDTSNVSEDMPEISWPPLEITFQNSFLYCAKRGYFPSNSSSISFTPIKCYSDALNEIKAELSLRNVNFNQNKYELICRKMQKNADSIYDSLKKVSLNFCAKYSYYILLKQSIVNQYIVQESLNDSILEKFKMIDCYFITGTSFEEIIYLRRIIRKTLNNYNELKFVDITCPYLPTKNSRRLISEQLKIATSVLPLKRFETMDLDEILTDDSILLEMLMFAPFTLPLIYGKECFEEYKNKITGYSEVMEAYSSFKNYIFQTLIKNNYNTEYPIIFSSPFHLPFVKEILQIFENSKVIVVDNKPDNLTIQRKLSMVKSLKSKYTNLDVSEEENSGVYLSEILEEMKHRFIINEPSIDKNRLIYLKDFGEINNEKISVQLQDFCSTSIESRF
ncbi:Male sterility protein family protein [Cryptosporidium meleagridis]|uniref:Male sterility protein family protein n=1 Tax=Cryptosporidium meleagridis TaxID=93969 RepID=A0A2P4Z2X6_9CRYT|nr:Male sterility protein family protein [Cryptosporidium meleagridis]